MSAAAFLRPLRACFSPLEERNGGMFGTGDEEYAMPWDKLTYDTGLGGYRTDVTEAQLRGAPTFYRTSDYDWSHRTRERELHDYWKARYYIATRAPHTAASLSAAPQLSSPFSNNARPLRRELRADVS
jgi:hypothetical protein